ncbi:zinc-binding dehydrogenase [Nocardia sp. R7R-8]|uniref:zinc-binding dehydrogenase n=1 Tax=Nocardia sp. R7R-8 TaxID=3459304 RepID=UPI00403D9240
MHTTAALSRGPASTFTLEEVELADLRPDEVLVRLVAVGICHTDLTTKATSAPDAPALYGHEGAGVVEQVGSAVTGIETGDHVLLSYNNCGTCAQCLAGRRAYCAHFTELNSSGGRLDGTSPVSQSGEAVWANFFGQSSFARHAIANRENVVVVPRDVDLAAAAPLGCGFQTGAGAVSNVLRPTADSTLVVYGAGGVGIAAVMAAHALGVQTIIAVDLSEPRRQLAAELGATHVLDGADPALVDRIREITGGGATHAFDTTSVPSVIRGAALALGALGVLVVVGIGNPEISFDAVDLIVGGKTVRGCIEGDADSRKFIPQLLEWHAQGKFPIEKVITRYRFEQINTAVADAAGAVIKPVLEF